MSRNYYYLVAGLPDVALDAGKRSISTAAFMEETASLLHEDDASLFNVFRYPYDNANLLLLLGKREGEFDHRGRFSRDELTAEIKSADRTPLYIKTFLNAVKENRLPYPDLSMENQLAWLFYDEACTNSNVFLKKWFSFELNLRNICAAYSCRLTALRNKQPDRMFLPARAIICRNDVTELLLKSTAPDFSLSGTLPWVERLASASRDNLVEYEKSMDLLRWDILNEMTESAYFGFETILAFTVKLGIAERWQQLDENAGMEMFDKITKELTAGKSSRQPSGPV
jgi:hypothetical protein